MCGTSAIGNINIGVWFCPMCLSIIFALIIVTLLKP